MNCTAAIEQRLDAQLRAQMRRGAPSQLRDWTLRELDQALRASCIRPLRAKLRLSLLRRARQRWSQWQADDARSAATLCADIERQWQESC